MLIAEAVIHLHVIVSSICIILYIALNLIQLPIIVITIAIIIITNYVSHNDIASYLLNPSSFL